MTDDTDLLMRAQTAEALLLDEERKNEALLVRIEELEARLREANEKNAGGLRDYQKAVLDAAKNIPVRRDGTQYVTGYGELIPPKHMMTGRIVTDPKGKRRLDANDYATMLAMLEGATVELPTVRIEQDMSTGANLAIITDGVKYYKLRLDMRRIADTRTMEDVERLFTDYANQALMGLGDTKKDKKLAGALGEQIALAVGRSSGMLRDHFSRIANRW